MMQCFVKEGGKPGVFLLFIFFCQRVCVCDTILMLLIITTMIMITTAKPVFIIAIRGDHLSFLVKFQTRKHCVVFPQSTLLHFILRYVPPYHQVSFKIRYLYSIYMNCIISS